ncbi:MAG: hypothetical protein ACP5H5_09385 [Pyrobaculum sp.]
MVTQIVDHSEALHTLGEVSTVVSPRCGCPPPAPRLASFRHLAAAVRRIYGVEIYSALVDQLDLGLQILDPVLLQGQLTLEASWIARLMPAGEAVARCVAPDPDPVTAAIAVVSAGARSVAVDLRLGYTKYVDVLAQYAEHAGSELQIVVSAPLRLPGDLVFHSSAPPHVRERYVKAVGDVSVRRGAVQLVDVSPGGGVCEGAGVDYTKTLERVAELLGLDMGLFDDLVAQGVLSHGYVLDHATPWQLGYLAKWQLARQVPGGWSATHKLVYLHGLYRGRLA